MGEFSRVVIYEHEIARLFEKNKDVARFGDAFAQKAVRIAKELTPSKLPPDPRSWKSQNLRERNMFRGYLRAGRVLGQVVLGNSATYARYAWKRGPVWANGRPDRGLQVPRVHMRLYTAMGDVGFGSAKGFAYPREVGPVVPKGPHWLYQAALDAAKGKIL